ncbi:hypothetical protein HI914_06056 [Erysiphe necator]|nr:hypothetical protein HI914_07570 [Erysiphe necator]KAI6245861.1 hypothetical protein HI914_06056 [Erysiphe necator]
MKTLNKTPQISARYSNEDTRACAESPLTFPAILTRGNRRTHRNKRSGLRDQLIQMTTHERVYSIAKLLALTSIPPLPKNKIRSLGTTKQRSTVNAILENINVSEKECDFSTDGSPWDIFLNLQDEISKLYELKRTQENALNKLVSKPIFNTSDPSRPVLPHFQSHLVIPESFETFKLPSRQSKKLRRKPLQLPRQLCLNEDHPLFSLRSNLNYEDQDQLLEKLTDLHEKPHLKSVDKRSIFTPQLHLKTSFHKIKSSLNSISSLLSPSLKSINPSSSPSKLDKPDLSNTRESLPIRLELVPTSQLRWYLNPITNLPIEDHKSVLYKTKGQRRCMVSIQMQTYKISISNDHPPHHVISYRTKQINEDQSAKTLVVRRRDMRENCDFLRVAVMEMLMRKRGKLDDQEPGKARLILPPRTLTTRPPETTACGIPLRWVPLSM